MMKQLLSFVFLTTLAIPSFAQPNITLEDIWLRGTFSPEHIWGLKHMADGEHYTDIKVNRSKRSIDVLVYDYEEGELQDTLFSGGWVNDSLKPFYFTSYSLSPTKDKILVAAKTEGIYRHSSKSHFYIFDRQSKSLNKLTTGSKQLYATFSPDGNKVAYVQDNNLFYRDLPTGNIIKVTHDGAYNKIINGDADWVYEEELVLVKAFFWSPDSRKIAFYRFDESRVKEYEFPIYGGQYPEIYKFKYPKVGEINSDVTLHCFFLNQGKTTRLPISANSDEYIPRLKWTKDADVLSVQKLNRHQDTLDFYLVNVQQNEANLLFTEGNPYYLDIDDDLTFLENGEQFIWTSERSGFNHIYLYDMDGKVAHQLTQGNWEVTEFYGLSEDEKTVYYQSAAQSPLERHIYSVDMWGKKKKMLTKGSGTFEADFAEGCNYYLQTWSDANTPERYSIHDARGRELRLIEDNKELQDTMQAYQFSDQSFFQFELNDGTPLNGYMIKPPDFDPNKEYPVFMFMYGGPGSQTVQNSFGGRNFSWFQMLAQQGYIVVSVDNRGTGARGQEFQKKHTYLKLGGVEVEDQVAAAKYLAGLDYVDEGRIGLFGWSYGGYMSSLCLFRHANLFAMGIAVAPVSNWKYYDTIYTERYMRTYDENKNGYEDGSPDNYAGGLEDPYLLVHGLADDNVHFQNSAELISALVEEGKQFDLYVYPNKAHSIGGSKTRLHLYTKMTEFIKENL
jgi:dipeptidyl-peptidase-4